MRDVDLMLIETDNGIEGFFCCQPGMHDIYFFVVFQFFTFVIEKGLKLITLTQLEIIEIENYRLENVDGGLLTVITSKRVRSNDWV